MSLTIPNALTLFRIIAIPLIVAIYFTDIQFKSWICVILFSLAGISDALDGYLARKWNQTSKLGAFLDPVADKLLVCIMLIIIAANFELRSSLWSKRSNVAVSNVGKFKTGMQMGAIGCLLFGKPFIGLPIVLIGETLLYIAGVLTVWSMTIYLIAAYKAVNEE